jgi:hypothetical protein
VAPLGRERRPPWRYQRRRSWLSSNRGRCAEVTGLAEAAREQYRNQERRSTHPAPRDCGAAPSGDKTLPDLAGSGDLVRPDPSAPPPAADPSDRHPGYAAGLAPPPGHQELDLPQPVRPTTDQRRNPSPGAAPGTGEPLLGASPNPRRTARARAPRGRRHDPPDPGRRPDRPGTTPSRRSCVLKQPGC